MISIHERIARLLTIASDSTINDEFYALAYLLNDDLKSEFSIARDDKEKDKVVYYDSSYGFLQFSTNLKDYFKEILDLYKKEIIKAIEIHLLELNDDKEKEAFLNGIKNSFEHVIQSFATNSKFSGKNFFAYKESCTELRNSVSERLMTLITSNKRNVVVATKKIKWKKDVASLCSLFYDLLKGNTYDENGNKNNGQYIENEPDDIAEFLFNNFEIANESNCDVESYKRYLRGNKTAKRHKLQIRINNNDKKGG